MKPNRRDLKAFVRFDGIGRIIPGSLVLRRVKPKNGHWHEITGYECCNPPAGIPEPHTTGETTTAAAPPPPPTTTVAPTTTAAPTTTTTTSTP